MREINAKNRRNFLKAAATVSIGGVLTLGIGLPGAIYVIKPALKKDEAGEWIRLGSTAKIQLGSPTLFSAKIETKTGWITNVEEILVYVYSENGRDYTAMSNVCTHLGCRVRWIEEQQKFFCPCHNGVFDRQGSVVSGPPPRALDRYEVKTEQDEVFIKAG